jgi:hypothetical protein
VTEKLYICKPSEALPFVTWFLPFVGFLAVLFNLAGAEFVPLLIWVRGGKEKIRQNCASNRLKMT